MHHAFPTPCVSGTLIQRYKRFFVDVELDDGAVITAHTSNTGAMRGLVDPGNRVVVTHEPRATRRLDYTLQAVHDGAAWVGVNTLLPNALTAKAIAHGAIAELDARAEIRREVPYPSEGRADLFVDDGEGPPAFVEVKSATLREGDRALFPDAVSERATRHLGALVDAVGRGYRGILVLFVQRGDCAAVAPAAHIDPAYAHALVDAYEAGVSLVGLGARVDERGVTVYGRIPFEFLPIPGVRRRGRA